MSTINKNYQKLFTSTARLGTFDSSEDDIANAVMNRVMHKIEDSRIIHSRIVSTVYGLISLSSIVAFISAVKYVFSEAYTSGFSGYASLFVSDTSYAFSNLKMILLSLVESMPIIGITVTLGILYIFGNSIKRAINSYNSQILIKHI